MDTHCFLQWTPRTRNQFFTCIGEVWWGIDIIYLQPSCDTPKTFTKEELWNEALAHEGGDEACQRAKKKGELPVP